MEIASIDQGQVHRHSAQRDGRVQARRNRRRRSRHDVSRPCLPPACPRPVAPPGPWGEVFPSRPRPQRSASKRPSHAAYPRVRCVRGSETPLPGTVVYPPGFMVQARAATSHGPAGKPTNARATIQTRPGDCKADSETGLAADPEQQFLGDCRSASTASFSGIQAAMPWRLRWQPRCCSGCRWLCCKARQATPRPSWLSTRAPDNRSAWERPCGNRLVQHRGRPGVPVAHALRRNDYGPWRPRQGSSRSWKSPISSACA